MTNDERSRDHLPAGPPDGEPIDTEALRGALAHIVKARRLLMKAGLCEGKIFDQIWDLDDTIQTMIEGLR